MITSPTELMTTNSLSASVSSPSEATFVDRRNTADTSSAFERRQFGNSHATLTPAARELAEAIDSYKVQHRRRYITFEEMLGVILSLGYQKQ